MSPTPSAPRAVAASHIQAVPGLADKAGGNHPQQGIEAERDGDDHG